MDQNVLRSLVQWPHVPHCFGWLALDQRGQWRMRDEHTQTNGLLGEPIQHTALNAFISRNYASDAQGRYFFQNGPQRVYVNLDATPWIVRMMPTANESTPWVFQTQCQQNLTPTKAFIDETGHIYVEGHLKQSVYEADTMKPNINSDHCFIEQNSNGIALLHDHDLGPFSGLTTLHEDACRFGGVWRWHQSTLALEPIAAAQIPSRFGFQKVPQP